MGRKLISLDFTKILKKGGAKVELSAIIVNITIEPPGLGGSMCISGGKKIEAL